MAIEEIDFLNFAKSLSSDSEINCRNIISRSYYAAYHMCLAAYKPDLGSDGGGHKKLASAIMKSPAKQDKSNGYVLNQLKFLRVSADYKLNENLSQTDASTAVRQAEKLHGNLPSASI
ncbi:MAG: hypothetical protein EPN17_16010 [Methylobacter sp.]|nr:MAG: hypothetical protein EPN17_16010 [Methylobacter sp.]